MAKVKILRPMAGPGVRMRRGDIVDVDAKQAKRLVEAGAAELVKAAPKKERAVKK